MARQPAKRRRVTAQDLDVLGDDDWRSDELSSLPATDEEESGSGSGSGSDSGSVTGSDDDDEEDVIDMLNDPASSNGKDRGKAKSKDGNKTAVPRDGVEVVIPLATGDDPPAKRKRGRPRKEPEPKVPKKRGRPRKYAPGEKRPRRSRRKLNPDGTPKKRGRPKKVVDPDAVMMKVPKRRGRPPKVKEEGQEESKFSRKGKKIKREFDLLAGFDLDFDIEDEAGIVPGVGGKDEDEWQDETDSPRKQDDILARLRRRILYRQQDAELADFVDSLGPDGEPMPLSSKSVANSAANKTATEAGERVDEGPRPGLPLLKNFTDANLTPSIPSSEKRKERQPFEPAPQTDLHNEAMSALAEAAASAAAETEEQAKQAKPKGRPPGSKNRRPDWENNPLFQATRAHINTGRSTLPTVSHGSSLSLYGSPSAASVGGASGSSLVKPTSSDAYFLFNTSKRARGLAGMNISTSSSLISSKLPALDARNLARLVEEQTRSGASISDLATRMYRRLLPVYLAQLLAGYAIIFHGVGSKTELLTELVAKRIDAEGDAVGVVAQGAMKGFKVEDLLGEIERAVGLGSLTISAAAGKVEDGEGKPGMIVSTLTAARAGRIVRRFSRSTNVAGPTKLFLILETFDAPGMQSLRFRSVLETLAGSDNIHIMATTEHVNSGFIAATTGHQNAVSSDKPPVSLDDVNALGGRVASARLCWIWQNMSTFTPSLDEMLTMRSNPAFSSWMPALPSSLDLLGSTSSFGTSHFVGTTSSGPNTTDTATATAYYNGLQVSDTFRTVSELSAISILKSVTTKARALFNLLAKQSLLPAPTGHLNGVAYADLLNRAKRSFLVSNEADFKSLLIEFKDHHLCHVNKQGKISIGLDDSTVLQSVLDKLKSI